MSNLHIKKLFYKRGLVKVKTVNKVMIPTTMRVKIGIANDRRWGGGLGRSDGVPTPIRHPYTIIHDPNRPYCIVPFFPPTSVWTSVPSPRPGPPIVRPGSKCGPRSPLSSPIPRYIYIYISMMSFKWHFFFSSFWTKFYT